MQAALNRWKLAIAHPMPHNGEIGRNILPQKSNLADQRDSSAPFNGACRSRCETFHLRYLAWVLRAAVIAHNRLAPLPHALAAQIANELRKRNLDRAHLATSPAERAQIEHWRAGVDAEKLGRNHLANGSGIGAKIGMPTDFIIHRAVIEAAPTANAAHGAIIMLVFEHIGAVIIEQDNVHFFGSIFLALFAWRCDDVVVACNRRAHSRCCQKTIQNGGVFEALNNLLNPTNGNMNVGRCRTHTSIALVFNQPNRAFVCNRKIHAAQAHFKALKLFAQMFAGDSVESFGLTFELCIEFFMEQFTNFIAIFMDSGHDNMHGNLAQELQDELAQVGFYRLESYGF